MFVLTLAFEIIPNSISSIVTHLCKYSAAVHREIRKKITLTE